MHKTRLIHRFIKQTIGTKRFYATPVQEIDENANFPRRIFSGIQPTGQIHLGNYLGAVSQWVKLQAANEDMLLSVVDLHSITLPQDPKTLSANILEMTATLLACGIDPSKVILFQQSMVPAHTQLSWCLGCISTMARLAHLPTFKEKSENLKDVPLGLYVYPVLQAADILAYKATQVPVGEDQAQNIQLTQDLARMFNRRYGLTFPIPHSMYTGSEFSRLKSLRDPNKKMSKSDPDPKSKICISDAPEEIVKKIKKSITDFTSGVTFEPETRPGVANLVSIHSFVTGKSVEEICREAQGLDTGKYKLVVADAVVAHVQPIQDKISRLLDDPGFLMETLKCGASRANDIAEKNLEEVQFKLGLKFDIRQKVKVKVWDIETN